jgi:hypothetical protein
VKGKIRRKVSRVRRRIYKWVRREGERGGSGKEDETIL